VRPDPLPKDLSPCIDVIGKEGKRPYASAGERENVMIDVFNGSLHSSPKYKEGIGGTGSSKFRPDDVFCFSVAFTCSRMRVDEFGGESYVITDKAIYSDADVAGAIIKALQTGKPQKLTFQGLGIAIRLTQSEARKGQSCRPSR